MDQGEITNSSLWIVHCISIILRFVYRSLPRTTLALDNIKEGSNRTEFLKEKIVINDSIFERIQMVCHMTLICIVELTIRIIRWQIYWYLIILVVG